MCSILYSVIRAFQTAEIVKENDGTGTLGRFCRWTGREKMNDFYGREQYDVAIYLTRKELGSAGECGC